MIRDEGDFLMTMGELAALTGSFSAKTGPLSLVPAVLPSLEEKKNAAAALKKLSAPEQETLKKAVLGLADPAFAARFHHAVSDETITRSVLAWPKAPASGGADEIVCVTRMGNNRRVSSRSAWELAAVLNRLLAAGPGMRDANFTFRLSGLAVASLLAFFDQLQHARLYSMLAHASPLDSVTPDEVFQRLAESELEDFRWVLPFLEKVLPTGALTAITQQEVNAALAELARAGLIEAVDASGALYQLCGSGQFAADAVFHNLSRAAVCVSSQREDGLVGYECLLFLRGPAGLFLYEFSGAEGLALTLSQPALDELLENLFTRSPNAGSSPAPEKVKVSLKPGSLPPPPERLK